jgi:hypothetical protein
VGLVYLRTCSVQLPCGRHRRIYPGARDITSAGAISPDENSPRSTPNVPIAQVSETNRKVGGNEWTARWLVLKILDMKRVYVTWFGIHFFLITAVCFAGLFSLIAEGATTLPSAFDTYARKAELLAASVLGKHAGGSDPLRRSIATYLHAAGIQSGYTFFAPNIPGYHKLIFELKYEDGRVEYESPHFRGKAAAFRLDSLLTRLGDERYEPLREVVVKMLALSIWRDHPDVREIRATFGSVSPPSIIEFENGKGESFQPLFKYDFSLRDENRR